MTHPARGMPHGATRREVLLAIRDGEADTTASLAGYLGLKKETIRLHLQRLRAEGLVSRTCRETGNRAVLCYRLTVSGQWAVGEGG